MKIKSHGHMRAEILQAPEVVARQLELNQELLRDFSRQFKKLKAYSWITLARGSSDNAAGYFHYLAALKLGMLSTSYAPSLSTLHQCQIKARRSLLLAISQSGAGPDINAAYKQLARHTLSDIAIVNELASPLARQTEFLIPMAAEQEHAVPATKTTIASFCAAAALVSSCQTPRTRLPMEHLPADLARALKVDWSGALGKLQKNPDLLILGRGLGLSLAYEVALKFKEACGIQAEAFSSAEFNHGPKALAIRSRPILILAHDGPELSTTLKTARELMARKANVLLAAPARVRERHLTMPSARHPELAVICALQSAFQLIERLAHQRGLDPDCPQGLQKITKTI